MRGRLARTLVLVGVLAVSVTTWWLTHENETEIPFEVGLDIGDEKDPFARLNYEKNRIKSPTTGEIPENILARERAYAQTLPLANHSHKADAWTQRGPYNIGGRTRAMAIDVNNSDVILTGGVSGGVYRSEDGGNTWTQVTGSDHLMSVTDIVQDTRDGKTNTWYYCSGEVYGNSADYPGDGIFKSTDGGKTWKGLQMENKPQEFRHLNYGWRLCLDQTRNDSDIVYLASYGAILRSNDGGLSWNVAMGGTQTNLYLAGTDIAQAPSGVFYATLNSRTPGNYKGIFRSENGLNWTDITPGIFPAQFGRIVLDIHEADESLVYFLAHTPNHGKSAVSHNGRSERNSLWKYRYLKGDGAGSNGHWVDLSDNIPALRAEEGYIWGDYMAQGGYNMVVRIKPDDSNFVAIGGTNIFVSSDGFKSSNNSNWIGGYFKTKDKIDAFLNGLVYPNHHPDVHGLIFHPDDYTKLISASDGGIAITKDVTANDVEWESLNHGYYTTQFYTAYFNQNPVDEHKMSNVVLGGFQDNETQYIDLSGKTEDDWTRIACCDGSYGGLFDEGDYTWILTSKQLGTLYLYKFDKDGTRELAGRIDPDGGANYQFINQLLLDPINPKRLYFPAGNFLWVNSDITKVPLTTQNAPLSTNWTRYLDTRTRDEFIISLDASQSHEGVVYMGTSGGNVYRVDNAHDKDNYTSTLLTDNNALDGSGNIESVSIDPKDPDQVLVAFSNYDRKSIFFTVDGGKNWRHVSGNLEENEDGTGAGTAVNVVKIVHGPNGPIYLAGTNSGLYSTTGLPGTSTVWNREGASEVGICAVRDIDFRAHDNLLFIGTHGCGSFSTTLDLVAGTSEPVVESIKLYPNPASDYFVIEHLNHAAITYRIYNASGRLVKQGKSATGQRIQASDLETGSYWIQCQMDGRTATSQIQIVR